VSSPKSEVGALGGALRALFHSSAMSLICCCVEEFPRVVITSWESRRELEWEARELQELVED